MNSSSSSGVTVGGGVGGVTITILATTAALAVVSTIASMVLSSSSTSSTSTSSSKKEQEQEVVEVTLPQWAHQADYFSNNNNNSTNPYQSDDARMRLAIELSARNVRENTGGPFGCAIFHKDLTTGIYTLSSIGVNRVVPLGNSTLHGEMVAIQMAQKKIGSFSLRGNNNNDNPHTYELYTSCEPCAMCLGAILWSGVSRVVCAATKQDASAIGFDEGPVYEKSYQHLQNAGVSVTRGVLQQEGARVLQEYGRMGLIYNR